MFPIFVLQIAKQTEPIETKKNVDGGILFSLCIDVLASICLLYVDKSCMCASYQCSIGNLCIMHMNWQQSLKGSVFYLTGSHCKNSANLAFFDCTQ